MQPKNEPTPKFPMRVNKYLAREGISTRRGADELIEKRLVFVNGKAAVLGQLINENDEVEVRGKRAHTTHTYYAFHKPVEIVTHSPGRGEIEITKILPLHLNKENVFPVSRLDKQSHGLIILTNDRRVGGRMSDPAFSPEKEYTVTTKEKLRGNFKQKMEAGVLVEGETEPTKPCIVEIMSEHKFRITVREQFKHQVRRMCVALFQEVDSMICTRVQNVSLSGLQESEYRRLDSEEITTFLQEIDLK
jgi:pseudouridine synthase